MSKLEIKGSFCWKNLNGLSRHTPCSLNLLEKLWWRFMPGVVINVRWPRGDVVIDESMPQWDWTIGPSKYIVESADPNDHYRPWLEEHVGRQGLHWNWGLTGNDAAENRLTIKIIKSKAAAATYLALKWG